jgi:hypothetical protein
MANRHVLQHSSGGLSVIVGVNRAHNIVDVGRGTTIILPINEWIMPENNELSIFLSRSAVTAPTTPFADIHLFVADPRSRKNDPLTTLAKFIWPLPVPTPSILPFLGQLPFKVTDPPPCSLWREAEKIRNLSNNDRLEILKIVERFRQALEHRNVDDAYALSEYKFRDSAVADGISYNILESALKEDYREMLSTPDLKSEPLTQATAVFDLVCDEKVVFVSRGLGKEALRFESESGGRRRAYGIQLYFAFIKNRWVIVR